MAEERIAPAVVETWEKAYVNEELDADDKAFWEAERPKYVTTPAPDVAPRKGYTPVAEEPPLEAPPRLEPVASADPRETSSWYQRIVTSLGNAFGRVGDSATTVDPMGGAVPTIPPGRDPKTGEPLAPGDVTDWQRKSREGVKYGARVALEHAPDVISTLSPVALPYWAARVPWIAAKTLPPLLQAGKYYGAQQVATRAANVVDPEHYTDPNESAKWTAIGEGAGRLIGRVPHKMSEGFREGWRTTPKQQEIIDVVEGLGGKTTPGMGSEKAWPQWVDVGMTHAAFGGPVRNVYDKSKKLVDEALDGIRATHPSGRVDAARHQLGLDVQANAVPTSIEDVPRAVRKTTDEVIDATNAKAVVNYEALDNTYRSYQVPWGQSQGQLPAVTRAEDLLTDPNLMQIHAVEPASIFHRTAALVDEMRKLPPTVTLDQLITAQTKVNDLMLEAQRHVNAAYGAAVKDPASWSELTTSIQKKVLGTLADTNHLLYGHLKPYLVDRGPAQELAEKVIGRWESSLEVPEQAMQRGNPGRMGVLEDPQIMAARKLLEKPKYGLFAEVHNDRALLNKIGRMKGPNMEHNIAREAQDMAQALDTSMTATGDALTPKLTPLWRATDAVYKQDIQLLNSPLIQELAEKDLDDIILTSVIPERANDLRAIKTFLAKHPTGGATVQDLGELWLTRKINASTDEVTGHIDLRKLQTDLKKLTKPVETELFPQGLTAMREKIVQGIGMEDAVAEIGKGEKSSVFKLRQLKNTINDPGLWHEVQSDVLSRMMHGKEGLPLDGDHLLAELGKISHLSQALFDPTHVKDLTALAHTSRVLNQVQASGKLAWSPMVRAIGHGVVIPAAIGSAAAYATGDPRAYALGGGYLLGTYGLAKVLATPSLVNLWRQLIVHPANTKAYGEALGALLGELRARQMSELLVEQPRPAGQHHPEDTGG